MLNNKQITKKLEEHERALGFTALAEKIEDAIQEVADEVKSLNPHYAIKNGFDNVQHEIANLRRQQASQWAWDFLISCIAVSAIIYFVLSMVH